MQLFQNILVSIALLTQVVFAIEITENKVDRGTVTLNLGDITIYPGASWSIIDNAYTNFVGKLDVRDGAGLYISLTSHLLALQVSLTTLLHSITNNGVVSFDSRISRTSSSYDLRGVSFTNNGKCTLLLPVSSPAPLHSLLPCGPTPGYCCFTKIKEPPAL